MHRSDTCPTELKSHKSRTTLVHHLVPFYCTVSRPGATDPRAKHQALAPSLPISLDDKLMSLTLLLTFNALARACGQKRWQTKWCETWELSRRQHEDSKIKPCPAPKIWSQDHESKSKVNIRQKNILLDTSSIALQVSEHRPPSHFVHLVSIPFQWRFWKDAQVWHLPNRTKVSQVSNNTGTPLGSILLHRFEAWSHRPPCQAPGLGSFVVNLIAFQVDVPHTFVDFQCFGKGLWTKTMAN